MRLRSLAGLALTLPLALVACGGDDDGGDDSTADGADDGTGEPAVSWHKDIAPLVAERCVSCHQEGGIGPFSLESFDSAEPYAGLMATKVEAGEMPPWDAVSTDDCETRFEWRDDPRPTEEERALFQAWADAGAPEGDPDDAAELPEPTTSNLADMTHTVEPEVGYATSGEADEFICFVLDPEISEPTWITGLHMVPSLLEVAHHAVLTVVPPEGQADLMAQVGPDGHYDCFGGVTSPGSYFAGVWVPGALPFETPSGVGIPLAADSLLVVQLHYHPGRQDSRAGEDPGAAAGDRPAAGEAAPLLRARQRAERAAAPARAERRRRPRVPHPGQRLRPHRDDALPDPAARRHPALPDPVGVPAHALRRGRSRGQDPSPVAGRQRAGRGVPDQGAALELRLAAHLPVRHRPQPAAHRRERRRGHPSAACTTTPSRTRTSTAPSTRPTWTCRSRCCSARRRSTRCAWPRSGSCSTARCRSQTLSALGSENARRAPPSSRFSAQACPWWAWAIRLTSARPRPSEPCPRCSPR